MSESTAHIDSTHASALIADLNEVRLERDWSYRQLADDIQRVTGFEISAQTLQPLLSVPPEERSKPYDRTLHKIRRYLDALKQQAAAS